MRRSREIYSRPWWLPGGHLQTLWGKLARKRHRLDLRREVISTFDGDEIELLSIRSKTGRPHLLLLHGLEGSVRSHYANGILSAAEDAGWNAHLMLFRSCGQRVNLTRRFYHSGDTGDVSFIIDRLAEEHPRADLFVVGVSLGGNVLLKYLGEGGDVPPNVRAAAAISVPYDLAKSAARINRGFSRLYQRFFLGTLKAKLIEKRKSFSELPEAVQIKKLKTMVEFDDVVTAPLHGFRDASDYYSESSAINFLARIRTPTLLLSAMDDPFLPPDVLLEVEKKARSNTSLHIEFLRNGGHVGFVGGRLPWRAEYYAERRVLSFFADFISDDTQPRRG